MQAKCNKTRPVNTLRKHHRVVRKETYTNVGDSVVGFGLIFIRVLIDIGMWLRKPDVCVDVKLFIRNVHSTTKKQSYFPPNHLVQTHSAGILSDLPRCEFQWLLWSYHSKSEREGGRRGEIPLPLYIDKRAGENLSSGLLTFRSSDT